MSSPAPRPHRENHSREHHPGRHLLRRLCHYSRFWHALSAGLTITSWLLVGSFVYFCADALRPPPDLHNIPADCDGIVALTGGRNRIEAGITLLRQEPGRQLLISGVSPHTDLPHILTATGTGPLPPALSRQISLGHQAATTIGNAWETAQWAEQRHLHHLILVTAGYHMRRSLLEFHDIAPQLRLTPYWVQPPAMNAPLHLHTLTLMLNQYSKLAGALLRIILPRHAHMQEGFRAPVPASPSILAGRNPTSRHNREHPIPGHDDHTRTSPDFSNSDIPHAGTPGTISPAPSPAKPDPAWSGRGNSGPAHGMPLRASPT